VSRLSAGDEPKNSARSPSEGARASGELAKPLTAIACHAEAGRRMSLEQIPSEILRASNVIRRFRGRTFKRKPSLRYHKPRAADVRNCVLHHRHRQCKLSENRRPRFILAKSENALQG
jgi:hypothetical protein